jgi:hypothetical protein
MTISDFQINSVIKTYARNMKVKVRHPEKDLRGDAREDQVAISEDGMKKMLLLRIGENVPERLSKHEQE